jgi:hypothetical protein
MSASAVRREKVIDEGRQPVETGLVQDPHRMVKNLAADPKQADRLNALRVDLKGGMKDQGDEGLKTARALPDPQPKKKEKK